MFVFPQAGYQITQQRHALANEGVFKYILYGRTHNDCKEKTVRITQLQLEQDSGKSLHDDIENKSLIDLNRAGLIIFIFELSSVLKIFFIVDSLEPCST